MTKELAVSKFDPNREAFQMRAQWKKTDNCRKQWFETWSWLLDERQQTLAETETIRREASEILPLAVSKPESLKSLKPVPVTSTGVIGWLASSAPVGVDEDIVRSLAKELEDDSLEMFVRVRLAADSGLPGLPASSNANRPFPGTGGGFSSTGTI